MWSARVVIRAIELLLCIACVITLQITDDESRRISHYLRNRSREWGLLKNVTWGTIGAALATVTSGGYVIITFGLLLATAYNELRGKKTELFYLGLGVILFAIVGTLALASIEDVPDELVDNAIILGSLCIATAIVFIIDLLIGSSQTHKKKHGGTQTFAEAAKPVTTATTTTTMITSERENKPNTSGNTRGDSPDNYDRKRDVDRENNNNNGTLDRPIRNTGRNISADFIEEERKQKYDQVERQLREYSENFEAARETSRDNVKRYRDPRRVDEERRIFYSERNTHYKPKDEVDTPRFPTDHHKGEPHFAKVSIPSVKIMRVEHDVEDDFENYRFSDASRYDNVPTRMRASKHRNAGSYDRGRNMDKDEMEMLEECFSVMRKTTTGTQTSEPSNPTDPGYVRHTASNWPRAKTSSNLKI